MFGKALWDFGQRFNFTIPPSPALLHIFNLGLDCLGYGCVYFLVLNSFKVWLFDNVNQLIGCLDQGHSILFAQLLYTSLISRIREKHLNMLDGQILNQSILPPKKNSATPKSQHIHRLNNKSGWHFFKEGPKGLSQGVRVQWPPSILITISSQTNVITNTHRQRSHAQFCVLLHSISCFAVYLRSGQLVLLEENNQWTVYIMSIHNQTDHSDIWSYYTKAKISTQKN